VAHQERTVDTSIEYWRPIGAPCLNLVEAGSTTHDSIKIVRLEQFRPLHDEFQLEDELRFLGILGGRVVDLVGSGQVAGILAGCEVDEAGVDLCQVGDAAFDEEVEEEVDVL